MPLCSTPLPADVLTDPWNIRAIFRVSLTTAWCWTLFLWEMLETPIVARTSIPTRITRLCTLLSVVALLVAPVPVGAIDWADDHRTDDSCCADESECAPSADTNTTDQPLDEDCCPSGCHSCFLQCCNGPLSLHAFSVTLGVDQSSRSARPTDDDRFFPAHPRAVYHPPRR